LIKEDDMREEERSSVGATLMAFFLGGLVGAGVALLLAPASGKETREKIKGLTDEALEKAEQYMDEVKTKTNSAIDKGKQFVDEKKTVLSRAVEAGKEAYDREKDRTAQEEGV
jgi:gas vesicle protein